MGLDGNIYGAASQGGTGSCNSEPACGAIFRVTPSSGVYEVVFSFSSSNGGGFPSGLTPASDGTFYGVTSEGGSVYHYTPSAGTLQTTTLPFPFPKGCPAFACFGTTVLSFGSDGNLHGFYTVYGSPDTGLYEVKTDGSSFQLFPPLANGIGPELLLASDGNFWFPQSTANGSSLGDIVTVSPSTGTVIQTLTPFSQSVSNPASIIEATDGTLWGVGSGVINQADHFGGGTIFNLNAGLPPR